TCRLSLIAGPCQMEIRDHAFMVAGTLKELCGKLGIGLVYNSSFDKANRTSLSAGIGKGDLASAFADPDFGISISAH
ncbi:3-deoxy-8-phosphooctulonate synthase, partial [Rhizobium leguminosarum]